MLSQYAGKLISLNCGDEFATAEKRIGRRGAPQPEAKALLSIQANDLNGALTGRRIGDQTVVRSLVPISGEWVSITGIYERETRSPKTIVGLALPFLRIARQAAVQEIRPSGFEFRELVAWPEMVHAKAIGALSESLGNTAVGA